jgi:hypothetical protein
MQELCKYILSTYQNETDFDACRIELAVFGLPRIDAHRVWLPEGIHCLAAAEQYAGALSAHARAAWLAVSKQETTMNIVDNEQDQRWLNVVIRAFERIESKPSLRAIYDEVDRIRATTKYETNAAL